MPRRGSISSTIRSANGPPPSAEGGKGWRLCRHKLLFRAFQARPKGFAIALWKPSPDRFSNYMVTQRWQVTAALSAAVTTAKPIGDAPTSQAEPSQQKGATQTPAALRKKGSGEEGLLSEKPPPPQILPTVIFSGGSAREGTFLQKRPLPRKPHFPISIASMS